MCGFKIFSDLKKDLSLIVLPVGICLPGFVAAHAMEKSYYCA